MTISLDSLTTDPVGTENGLVTRNIPSGTQMVEVTDGYGNILGTSSDPLVVSSGAVVRTTKIFTALNFAGVGNTETLITFTPYSNYVAGSTGTSFGVTSGKTLRIQAIIINAGTGGGFGDDMSGYFRLLVSSSGSVTTSTPVMIPMFVFANGSFYSNGNYEIPGGLELTGSDQFGMSHYNSSSNFVYSVSVVGYEY